MRKRSSKGENGSESAVPCPFVKFVAKTVRRDQIKNAPYNPRKLTAKSRKKLKRNLENVGLLEPPVWNVRTGNLVGGHQRLSILDQLMGTKEYLVPVAEVDLDEKAEREQNIFLNNPDAQGQWDMPKFESMLKDGVDFDNAGLDVAEMVEAFGADIIQGQSEKLAQMAEGLRQAQDVYERIKRGSAKRDGDFYRVLVFKTPEDADQLSEALGMAGEVFLNGADLMAKLAVDDGEEENTTNT